MLCLNKGNIALSSGSIWCTSYRNEMKKVFWMFVFENLIKKTKFSVPSWRDSRPNSLYIFSLDVPRMASVIAKHALY